MTINFKLLGMAIQWGAIGDVGVVIDTLGDNNTVIGGTLPQRMHSCLQALDILLQADTPVVASFVRLVFFICGSR